MDQSRGEWGKKYNIHPPPPSKTKTIQCVSVLREKGIWQKIKHDKSCTKIYIWGVGGLKERNKIPRTVRLKSLYHLNLKKLLVVEVVTVQLLVLCAFFEW
jgi:hypothetical protein